MNVIIVHGSFGKPFENWFPWLEKSLSDDGISCLVPSFPTPNKQNYDDWSELLKYYLSRGYLNSETLLIGHSCGAAFINKFILMNNINVKGTIAVSGYNNFYSGDKVMDGLNSSFYLPENRLCNIANFSQKRISYYSTNDPFVPFEILNIFAEVTKSKKVINSSGGHFNSNSGYDKFDELLKEIKEQFI